MNTYKILEENLERLEKKLNRIRTKCEKYGCGFYYSKVGEEFHKWTDPQGREQVSKFVIVECEGNAKINGWVFAATLEHTDAGNIVRSVKDVGVEIPQRYYTCSPECEHCKSARHRKNTYIVYNSETEEFKQVGSSCLCDFTGGYDAELAAAYIALFDELIKGETPYPGSDRTVWMNLEDVLVYALDYVKNFGYVSSAADEERDGASTKSKVRRAWSYDNYGASGVMPIVKEEVEKYRAQYNPDYDDPELHETAKAIIEYIQGTTEENNYMHNLRVLAADDYIKINSLGFAVSMIPCYNKYLGKLEQIRKEQEAAETCPSEYQGQEGQRLVISNIDEIVVVSAWETMYGFTTRFKITDKSGNIYMWDSSSGFYQDKEVEKITGTVKKHDEYKGIKQTWLTRCRIAYAD